MLYDKFIPIVCDLTDMIQTFLKVRLGYCSVLISLAIWSDSQYQKLC